jgi:hypothetical protein
MSTKNGTNRAGTGRDVGSELLYLTKALKAPALRDTAARLAERALDEDWSHQAPRQPNSLKKAPLTSGDSELQLEY